MQAPWYAFQHPKDHSIRTGRRHHRKSFTSSPADTERGILLSRTHVEKWCVPITFLHGSCTHLRLRLRCLIRKQSTLFVFERDQSENSVNHPTAPASNKLSVLCSFVDVCSPGAPGVPNWALERCIENMDDVLFTSRSHELQGLICATHRVLHTSPIYQGTAKPRYLSPLFDLGIYAPEKR